MDKLLTEALLIELEAEALREMRPHWEPLERIAFRDGVQAVLTRLREQ